MKPISIRLACLALSGFVSLRADSTPSLESTRRDAVAVRPDAPIMPHRVPGAADDAAPGTVFDWTYTLHGGRKTVYLFAYHTGKAPSELSFSASDFGLAGDICVVDPKSDRADFEPATKPESASVPPELPWSRIIVPVSGCKIALVGCEGLIFADGRKRIPSITDDGDKIRIRILFARGENLLRVYGYAKSRPQATAIDGQVGTNTFDPETGRFTLQVSPQGQESYEGPDDEHVLHATIELRPSP